MLLKLDELTVLRPGEGLNIRVNAPDNREYVAQLAQVLPDAKDPRTIVYVVSLRPLDTVTPEGKGPR
jgi:hypothetical protein